MNKYSNLDYDEVWDLLYLSLENCSTAEEVCNEFISLVRAGEDNATRVSFINKYYEKFLNK